MATDVVVITSATTATEATYAITSVASGGITLTTDPGDDAGGDIEWKVQTPATEDYELPDDFGRLYGELTHESGNYYRPVVLISVARIQELRGRENEIGLPYFGAVQYKSHDDQSEGQRLQIMMYPTPDSDYALTYTYEKYSGALSDSNAYPLGGMKFSELYIESCLSVAEQNSDDTISLHTDAFYRLLVDGVARDMKQGAQFFGHVGHKENSLKAPLHGDTPGTYPITYKGSTL